MVVFDRLSQAVFNTVHKNGGPRTLAPRMGLNPTILSNKANPRQLNNRLTLEEAVDLMAVTRDHQILHAIAQELDYALIPLQQGEPSDVALLTLYAQWQGEMGQVHQAIASAFEDQRITPAEQAEIEHRFHQAETSGLTYLQRMGGLVQ